MESIIFEIIILKSHFPHQQYLVDQQQLDLIEEVQYQLEHYQDNEQKHGKYYNINGEETTPDHVRSTFDKILQSINTIT